MNTNCLADLCNSPATAALNKAGEKVFAASGARIGII